MLPEAALHRQSAPACAPAAKAANAAVPDDGVVHGYELIDFGDGARLERFADHLVDRPHAAALAPRRAPGLWSDADLRFDRDRGWSGPGLPAARAGWRVHLRDIRMDLRPTDAGQVGLFPEHADRLAWLGDQAGRRLAEGRTVEVLNLFAYTGLATIALAGWGAAVTHLDASRPSVAWARQNAAVNGLEARPIRWIVDDASAYARREIRRGRRYDGIVLDPPAYGHGGTGAAWRLEKDLGGLLDACATLLRDDGFLLLTTHSDGYGADRIAEALTAAVPREDRGAIGRGDVRIESESGALLTLGAYVTLDRRA